MEGETAVMMYREGLLMEGGTPCLKGVPEGLWPMGDPHQSRDTLRDCGVQATHCLRAPTAIRSYQFPSAMSW